MILRRRVFILSTHSHNLFPGDKDKLQVVANSVMILVDALVRKSEQQLSDSGKVLQVCG